MITHQNRTRAIFVLVSSLLGLGTILAVGAMSQSSNPFIVFLIPALLGGLVVLLRHPRLQFLMVLLLMGMSARFLAGYRLNEGSFPVSAHDVLYGFLAVSGLFAFARLPKRPSFLTIVMFVFLAYFSSVAVLNGFASGRNSYAVFQELRWFFYFAGAYFATISLLQARDLKSVVWMFIAASFVSVGWQITAWLTGADLLALGSVAGGDVFRDDPLRLLRDTGLGWATIAVTIAVLLALELRGTRLVRFPFGLLTTGFMIVITVLAATRSFFLPVLATATLQVPLAARFERGARSVLQGIRGALLIAALLLFSVIMIKAQAPSIYSSIETLWESTFSASDETYSSRLDSSMAAIEEVSQEPISALIGLGLGNSSSGVQMEGLVGYDAAAHNGYVWLLVSGGWIGLAIYLLLLGVAFRDYIRAARASSGMSRSLAIGFGMGLLSIHLMMFSGASIRGVWAPLYGILIGIVALFQPGVQIEDRN